MVEPAVNSNDFLETQFITTVVVVVPKIGENDFIANYETLTDNVIPYSAKKLGAPEKDGLNLW